MGGGGGQDNSACPQLQIISSVENCKKDYNYQLGIRLTEIDSEWSEGEGFDTRIFVYKIRVKKGV